MRISRAIDLAIVFAIAASLLTPIGASAAVKLTAAQNSFFPQNDPIDEKLWKQYSYPFMYHYGPSAYNQKVGTRFSWKPAGGETSSDVCKAWLQNEALWGGGLSGGCAKLQINPKLSHRDRFTDVSWNRLNPLDHIEVIRDAFVAAQPAQAPSFQSSKILNYYWFRMAPIVKRLLERNQVVMEDAMINLGDGPAKRHVYAVTLLPYSECLNEDGSQSSDHTMLYVEGSGGELFNRTGRSGTPIYYSGHTIWPSDDGIFEAGRLTQVCTFQKSGN